MRKLLLALVLLTILPAHLPRDQGDHGWSIKHFHSSWLPAQ